ncbi:MAG: hypothetical protein OXU48_00640 [candidate division Zixibacteria bacterium]|nr:hypothetical protein [candidate division Zixibacteria bacterium]
MGSAAESSEYRDVDVRLILDDDRFCEIFGKAIPYGVNPLWSLMTTAVSEYLGKRTGLPVDFQIQCRSMVKESEWKKSRHPMALYVRGVERRQIEEDRREAPRRTKEARPIPRERPPRRGDPEIPEKQEH